MSVGVRGLRIGKDAKGRTYSQTSIPGTGIYNRKYYRAAQGDRNAQQPQQQPQSATETGLYAFAGLLVLISAVTLVTGHWFVALIELSLAVFVANETGKK
jgi:hypothetical protein